MKFLALNVDFSSPSPTLLLLRWVAQAGIKEGSPSKKWLFILVGLSSVKIVADMHRHAAYDNNTSDELLKNFNIDDF